MGMTKKEIKSKYDEIVDFSGVERYIDTPVKRYSSGMYVRLAFSVAAHLDPKILIIDEVLAVGDAEFQKKCLGKMKDVSERQGRTVLFVSHNMNAVLRLCSNVILMEHGKIFASGSANSIINKYLNRDTQHHTYMHWRMEDAPGNNYVKLREVKITDEDGKITDVYDIRRPVFLHLSYYVLRNDIRLTHAFVFHDEKGNRLFDSHDVNSLWRSNSLRKSGIYSATLMVPGNFFAEGKVKVSPAVITSDPFEIHFYQEDLLAFMVVDSTQGDSARGEYAGTYHGLVRPLFDWQAEYRQ
jgi:lipopolysaccharide transport system ATP-binding protein